MNQWPENCQELFSMVELFTNMKWASCNDHSSILCLSSILYLLLPPYLLLLGPKETHSPIRIISNFLLKPTYFASHSGCSYYITLCNRKSLRFNRERDHLEEAFVLCEVLSCPSEQQKMEERRPTTTKKLLQRNTKSYFFCYKNS